MIPDVLFMFWAICVLTSRRGRGKPREIETAEMYALAMGAFVGLLIGALLPQKGCYEAFWSGVYEGAKEAVPVGVLLLIIGMFSACFRWR